MSAKHMGQVFDLALSHSQAWVLLAMADHADHLGERIWPSVALLAWKTGYCERQVQTILGQLRALGVIEFVQKATGRPGQTNHYRLTLERGPLKPPFRPDQEDETGAVSAPVTQPGSETGAVSGETGAVSAQRGAVTAAPESPLRIIIENRGDADPPTPLPPVPISVETDEGKDDPEDLWAAPVMEIRSHTPKQVRLLAFARSRGATLDHPSIGDLRGEWLREMESPGLTAEEADEAFRAAGPHCLPSGFRRFAPSAQERQDRADAIERRKRDAEYLASVERQRDEWSAHCARVLAAREA